MAREKSDIGLNLFCPVFSAERDNENALLARLLLTV